jgi:peptidoglycan/LPS O-acetylase OafA/YrhL
MRTAIDRGLAEPLADGEATKSFSTPSQSGRLPQLDFLRGIAILLVMGRHQPVYPSEAGSSWFRFFPVVLSRFGWTGVDLFFVLSGFLVGGLLFKEFNTQGKMDIGRFLIRRTFKIWPSYYAYLAFLFVLMMVTHELGGVKALTVKMLPQLSHLQNYLGMVRTHTWSLAIEEHFYIVLPLVLLWASRSQSRPFATVPLIAAALAVGCLLCRFYLYFSGVPYSSDRYLFLTHLRVDSLFFGVLLAFLHHCRSNVLEPILRHRTALLWTGLLLLSPMLILQKETCAFVPTIGLTEIYLGYACILLAVVHTPLGEGWLGRFLSSSLARIVAWVGCFSYSIYLWHLDLGRDPVRWLVSQGFFSRLPPELHWCLGMLLFVCLASLAGAMLGSLIEMPALALRNRLFPAHADALTRATIISATHADRSDS